MNHRNAVFIDVDLTLLNCESFRVFLLKKYFGTKYLKIWTLVYSYVLKNLNIYDILKFKQQTLSIFKGMERSRLEMIGSQFSKIVLGKKIRHGALECLNKNKVNGVPVYLASASPNFYIKALSDQLNLSGFFATELEFDKNNKFTGEFLRGECIGEEKAKRIIEFSDQEGIDLNTSFFYSDSFEDLPLLTSVGFPVAVWPDNQLKEICIQKGWAIKYW